MAVTLQELQNLARTAENLLSQAVSKVDNALSILQSITDPCASTSQATLDRGIAAYADAQQAFNVTFRQAYNAFADQWQTAPEPIKSQANELLRSLNQGQDRAVARATLTKETRDSLKKKVQDCITANAAKPATAQTASTQGANANVVTANATTSTQNQSSDDSAKTLNPVKDDTVSKPDSTTSSPQNAGKTESERKDDLSVPGRRLYNPLGKFPTYTYNLTLYMVSPKAYDEFIFSGRLKLNVTEGGGALIIAQSGGINATTQTRAKGFGLDYYIDNLRIITATSGKDNGTSTNTTELEFQITEPYGFSFVSNLKAASDQLIADSKVQGLDKLGNAARQFFIIGIRFTGFNEDGTPASSDQEPLFERFYDVAITGMSFKLDGKATVYNVKAASMAPGTAFGTKRGVWTTGGKLKGTTVYDILTNMMETLNKQSADSLKAAKSTTKPNKYSFKFMGEGVGETEADQRRSPIFKSLMKSETEIGKAKLVGNTPDNTGQRPVSTDQGKPNTTASEITIPSGTPILQAFELIISRSAYIEDAFKTLQTSALENNPQKTQGTTQLTTDNQGVVRWYNVSAQCTNAEFSKELGDFTWDILYIFTVYETPVVINPYSNLGIKYYGPHKRYNYWYTGQNSEIISYNQNLDLTYFNVAVNVTDQNINAPPSQNDPPTAPSQPQNAPATDTQNTQSAGKKAYITSLFDPGAYANASVRILGDPDYLMPESTTSVQSVYSQFYGPDGYTINPNGGQVFVEIDFKEPEDYGFKRDSDLSYFSTDNGLLSLNEQIQFWPYQKEIDEIVEGVSYQVWNVKSTFSQGKFEQDLSLIINQFPGYQSPEERARSSATGSSDSGSAAAPAQSTSGGVSSGSTQSDLKKDAEVSTGSAATNIPTSTAPPTEKKT